MTSEQARMNMMDANAHDAKMNAIKPTTHTTKLGKHGRRLKLRSWGVTTLHHYERISSRDLEWHRRDNGKGRETVKLSCFFDKRVKPNNLERLNKFKKRIQRR